MTYLHYDILLDIIPFLDPPSLVHYATSCRALCMPGLGQLWQCPHFTNPAQLRIFIECLSRPSPRPYHLWITSLTITFHTLQPIPLAHQFQSLLQHRLTNLSSLSLCRTHAVLSPTIRYYRLEHCMIKDSKDCLDSHSEMTSALTHLEIITTDMHFTDEYLFSIVRRCPGLRHVRLTGIFSDRGISFLADHCPDLHELVISLPGNLVQSNTITQLAIDRLAVSCPLFTRLVCIGQIRINPIVAEQTLRSHCKYFTFCDFGEEMHHL